jgi:hypothetical protein
MKQRTKLRPWQFSLRFLLAVTALVAVGAAFFGWRERQLAPQRRAVARIVEFGGSVEMERRGWIEAVRRGCDTEEVVSVTFPGHLADDLVPELKSLRRLRQITLAYSKQGNGVAMSIVGGITYWYTFVVDGQTIDPSAERPRFDRLSQRFPGVNVAVSHNGAVVNTDAAFDGSETFGPIR